MSAFKSRWIPVMAVLFAAIIGFAQDAVAASVFGRVLYRGNGRPIPGLNVYVVHPTAGRSRPVATNSQGHFAIANVPPRRDAYYLEVYWGNTLKYRKSLVISEPGVSVPDIAL